MSRHPRRSSFRPDIEILEARTLLSVFTVDRLTDTGEGSQLTGHLRYCLTQATSGEDTIQFSVTGTINLTQALPDLAANVNIQGPGADLLTVRRNTADNYRIFTVMGTPIIAISGLTISNGVAPALADGTAQGGGI
jgi:hypothetical protein